MSKKQSQRRASKKQQRRQAVKPPQATQTPQTSSAEGGGVMELQRRVGNQAVQRMIKNGKLNASVHQFDGLPAVRGVIQKADLDIQRDTIEERLNEAMDGWGTDEDAIMSITSKATAEEKLAILNNPRLVNRLAGELNQSEMLQVLKNLNAPLAKRLNVAMDGWGTDEDTIMSLTAAASDAEKQAILNDKALVNRLAGELNQSEMLQVLENLNAPLDQRLNVAMDGWGTDEEAIYKITKNATDAQKRAIGDNTTLMMRLIDELTEEEMQRVVQNLGLHGAAVFTNSTDTGNEYTSLAVMFKDGLTISKDVQFIEEGTFGTNGFDTLKGRVMGAVTSYLSGKYKVKVSSPTDGPKDGDGEYPITVRVNDQPSAEYPMRLHGGEHGRSEVDENGGDIYELGQDTETSIPDIVLAHESAHMVLGASDEYANSSVPGRVISNDHSLMGNFYAQGIAAAEIKARHFEFLVKIVNGWFPDRTVSIEK